MKRTILLAIGLNLLVSAGTGCSRSGGSSTASTPEEAVPAMQSTFENASTDVKQEVEGAVTAITSQNDEAAYEHLENLSQQELNEEQREAMRAAQRAVIARIAAEATNGNAAAEALMNRYRSSK